VRPGKRPGEPGYEWYVAWRYLGKHEGAQPAEVVWTTPSGWLFWRHLHKHGAMGGFVLLVLGLLVLLAGAALLFGPSLLHHSLLEDMYLGRADRRRILQLVGMGTMVVGFVLGYLGILVARFSIFTAISMWGVFLGVFAPIVVLSVMSGFETDLKQKILGQHGDVVVSAPERAWTGWETELAKVRKVPEVRAASPYLESEVMIQSETNNAGIEFRGIDPTSVGAVTNLAKSMEVGSLDNLLHPDAVRASLPPILELGNEVKTAAPSRKAAKDDPPPPPDPPVERPSEPEAPPLPALPGVVLGAELAKNLRVYPGDEVRIACLACGVGPTGPIPNQKTFRVVGLFRTGMYEFDTKIAYTVLPTAQKFLSLPGEITGLEVRTVDLERSGTIADRIRPALGAGYEVKDWRELNRSLFAALKMEKIAMFVVLGFIVLVAAFSIISTLIMTVYEKARDIAILKAMGAKNAGIVRIFLLQGLYIGVVGLLAGLCAGFGACGLLARFGLALDPEVYYIAKLPVHIDPIEIAAVSVLALGISCAATLYPALLAANLRPVEGLRYE